MINSTAFHPTEGGIFAGKGLLSSPLALFLVQVTIILALTRIIHWVLQGLRQPRVIAEIIGGICLGPSLLGNIPHFTETIFPKQSLQTLSLVASFGLVMYMFLMGLELDTSILSKGVKRIMLISVAGIILPGVMGSFVSYGLYEFLLEPEKRLATPFSSFMLFTFVAMAITAFPVLARILTETKLLPTTVGQMSISAAALDDICAWVLLALTISIVNAGDPFSSLYVLITISVYAVLLILPGRLLLQKFFTRFFYSSGSRILTQLVLPVIFAMIFLSAWTTEWIGVHAIFGAFLIGVIIPRMNGITMELTNKLEDFVGVALLPLYFASSGLKTKMALLNDWTTALFCVIVIVVACAGKIIGCTLAAKWSGFGWREAVSIGVLMNTKGLVELIVLNIGLDAGVINERIFAVMIVMALVTTFMTSPLISYIYPPKYQHLSSASTPLPMGSVQKRVLFGLGASVGTKEDPGVRGEMIVHDVDERIVLYLNNTDSIAVAANILLMIRGSVAPDRRLIVNGLKAYTDVEASSNIMVGTQTEFVVETDPALKMLRIFGQLIDADTHSMVTTTRLEDLGEEVDRLAAEQHCDTVIVPCQREATGSYQRRAVLSILKLASSDRRPDHAVTIGAFVDRRTGGINALFAHHQQPHGSISAPIASSAPPFTSIIVPVTSTISPNDCAALHMAFQLRRHANVSAQLKVVYLQLRNPNAERDERELAHAVKFASKTLLGAEHMPATFHIVKSHQPGANGTLHEHSPEASAINSEREVFQLKSQLAKLIGMSDGHVDGEPRQQHELVILPHNVSIQLSDGATGQHPSQRLQHRFSSDVSFVTNSLRPANNTLQHHKSAPIIAQKRPSAPNFLRQLSGRLVEGSALSEEQQIFGTLGEWLLAEPNGPSLMVLHARTANLSVTDSAAA